MGCRASQAGKLRSCLKAGILHSRTDLVFDFSTDLSRHRLLAPEHSKFNITNFGAGNRGLFTKVNHALFLETTPGLPFMSVRVFKQKELVIFNWRSISLSSAIWFKKLLEFHLKLILNWGSLLGKSGPN